MAPAKQTTPQAPVNSATHAPSGKPWAYGIRTWAKDGSAHGGFLWNLTPGAITTAPDWKPTKQCGNGLHVNHDGLGDWGLLSSDADAIIGIVRWDPDQAVLLDGKTKAPWMETVATSETEGRIKIMVRIGKIAGAAIRAATASAAAEAKASGKATGEAHTTKIGALSSTAGDGAHSSTAGDGALSSTAGDGAHSSTAGTRAHSSTSGKNSIAAAWGDGGAAKASETGAIALAHWAYVKGVYTLVDVFAGMVGKTYKRVTIKADTFYRLTADGRIEVVKAAV